MENGTTGEIEISDFSRLSASPIVSVQMLTFQHAPYLAEAIEGVLAQLTDFPIELLIADDASSDGSCEIAKRYQRLRPDVVRIVTGPVNIGAYANRQRVARRTRGEFVAFCEGDDYWIDPHKLQSQIDWLRTHPEAGAVHTDFDHVLLRKGIWRRLPNFQKHRFAGNEVPSGSVFSTLLRENFMQTCTLCVRADLDREFLANFVKESYPVGDWPLCLYIAAEREIGYLSQSTAVYRRVAGSMMNAGLTARTRTAAAYIPMIEDVCSHTRVTGNERVQALQPIYRGLFSLAFLAHEDAEFDLALSWLGENDPAYAKSLRARLLPWLRKVPAARWALRQVQDQRERSREARQYR
jgi:glycosyltransferase involved in cell wall biosynthesis